MEHQYPQEFVENIEKIVGSSEENNMNSAPEESASNELTVDDSVWRTGQVSEWKTTWGFITPLEETTEEKAARNRNRIFIHASKVDFADNEKPFLRKGMQIRYHLATRVSDENKQVAVDVQSMDGSPVDFFSKHGETDRYNRTELDGDTVYTGTVKKYFFRRCFGWIEADETIESLGSRNNQTVYVAREDIISNAFPPGLRKGAKVEFQLYKDDRGFGARNVTGLNGQKVDSPFSSTESYEGEVFTGTVVKFKINRFVFIKPEDDLTMFGIYTRNDLHGSCEDINTTQRPARLEVQMKVTFRIKKDRNGYHAYDINDTDGQPIQIEPEEITPRERECRDGILDGTVEKFRWDTGVGWIQPTSEVPEDIKNLIQHKQGFIYFHRDDLQSTDKVFGVTPGTVVTFKTYSDAKGVGAFDIFDANGESLCNQSRPEEPQARRRATGYVRFYDRKKRVCHVSYKGRVYAVSNKNNRIPLEARIVLSRGVKVQFTVENRNGKRFLKNLKFANRATFRGRGGGRRRGGRGYGNRGRGSMDSWQQYTNMFANMLYYQQQYQGISY